MPAFLSVAMPSEATNGFGSPAPMTTCTHKLPELQGVATKHCADGACRPPVAQHSPPALMSTASHTCSCAVETYELAASLPTTCPFLGQDTGPPATDPQKPARQQAHPPVASHLSLFESAAPTRIALSTIPAPTPEQATHPCTACLPACLPILSIFLATTPAHMSEPLTLATPASTSALLQGGVLP